MSSFADEVGSTVSNMGADASLKGAELTKDLVAAGINQLIYLNSAEHKLQVNISKNRHSALDAESQTLDFGEIAGQARNDEKVFRSVQVQEYIDRLAEKAAQLEKQSENQQDIQPEKQVEIQREKQSEIKQEKQPENQLEKQLEKQSEYERKYKQGKQLEKQPEKQQSDKKQTIKVKPMTMERWHKLTKAERKALPVDVGIARVIAKGIRHKGAIDKVDRSSR